VGASRGVEPEREARRPQVGLQRLAERHLRVDDAAEITRGGEDRIAQRGGVRARPRPAEGLVDRDVTQRLGTGAELLDELLELGLLLVLRAVRPRAAVGGAFVDAPEPAGSAVVPVALLRAVAHVDVHRERPWEVALHRVQQPAVEGPLGRRLT
jgi:hypothetical protein